MGWSSLSIKSIRFSIEDLFLFITILYFNLSKAIWTLMYLIWQTQLKKIFCLFLSVEFLIFWTKIHFNRRRLGLEELQQFQFLISKQMQQMQGPDQRERLKMLNVVLSNSFRNLHTNVDGSKLPFLPFFSLSTSSFWLWNS